MVFWHTRFYVNVLNDYLRFWPVVDCSYCWYSWAIYSPIFFTPRGTFFLLRCSEGQNRHGTLEVQARLAGSFPATRR